MKKMRILWGVMLLLLVSQFMNATPVDGLLERIDKGASQKFIIERVKSEKDFFELDQRKGKVVVRGNNFVSIATGINWYLKYYAGIHLSWNQMQAKLPVRLPAVVKRERHETDLVYRYDFNYCTYSYSMAFWDWARWEREIDWMAMHGINLPLCIVGTSSVWRNVLLQLGYTKKEANDFVAGPAFQAWWLMNNLEGWGGPNPDRWYDEQEALQKKILTRMREYGIHPVLPGYSGMVPSNAKEKLGLNVADPGRWTGFHRPAFLQPSDPNFRRIAEIYYKEMTKLYGQVDFYSMDPFHEGGNTKGVDLDAAGKSIWKAMKQENPKAVWVAQAWGACPYDEMIRNLPAGDMMILDLYSESRPQWGTPDSRDARQQGFRQHSWLYCMLLNFGGNVGLYGKMEHVIDGFYQAKASGFGQTLKGVGMTMEGIENNPVMYELLCELPWRAEKFSKDTWLKGYIKARYGKSTASVEAAWLGLSNTIYNSPAGSIQQGTNESVFCARPSLKAYQVSTWLGRQEYYQPEAVIELAGMMLKDADAYRGSNNFEYDLVDVVRQAVAEKGRQVYPKIVQAYQSGEKKVFRKYSEQFLHLILLQDKLLGTRREFGVGAWLNAARAMGATEEESRLYEWNARVQITTWGNRFAANDGGLHDYAHKEWNGLLRDFYYQRWATYFNELSARLNGLPAREIDFYPLEEDWTKAHQYYREVSGEDPIEMAKAVYREIAD
uniref:Alpha-N-acetylglucosaminidase n=1 Tax=Prevotella sp. GTC17259 TaxID=3236795 RepID=A0AB33J474_9BACT